MRLIEHERVAHGWEEGVERTVGLVERVLREERVTEQMEREKWTRDERG